MTDANRLIISADAMTHLKQLLMIFVVDSQEVQLLFVQVQETFTEVLVFKSEKRLLLVITVEEIATSLGVILI